MKQSFLKKIILGLIFTGLLFISGIAIADNLGVIDPNDVGYHNAAFLNSSVVTNPSINFGKFTTESQYNILVTDSQLYAMPGNRQWAG